MGSTNDKREGACYKENGIHCILELLYCKYGMSGSNG